MLMNAFNHTPPTVEVKFPARKRATITHESSEPEALATGLSSGRDKSVINSDAAWLSMPQLETLIGLHRTRVYAWIRQGLFPLPIKLGKTSRWPRAEIEQWLANVAASRTLNEGGAP
jgi:predicted DNA-binding transcriptional regulator AlpA